ncbi:hypothetical protein BURK2_02013 [Burkholderiales bacterium]|nr:hypothetical protein BURK2_02013 [Burkholderiales bacterium]
MQEDELRTHLAGKPHLVGGDDHGTAFFGDGAHDPQHLAHDSGSSAEVGSSKSITCGSIASARNGHEAALALELPGVDGRSTPRDPRPASIRQAHPDPLATPWQENFLHLPLRSPEKTPYHRSRKQQG